MAAVRGIRETIMVLHATEELVTAAQVMAATSASAAAAGAVAAAAPSAPLSNMAGGGATRAVVRPGGQRKDDGTVLAKVVLTGPPMTVASDMAARANPGQTMVPNLEAKYGGPSRWVWPTVERVMPSIEGRIIAATKAVEAAITAKLRT